MVKIIAKCVDCGHEDEIIGGEIVKYEQPICQKCGSIMIAKKQSINLN